MLYLCNPCGFGIHARCADFPGRLKVIRHIHLLNLIHCLEFHQSYSQLCQIHFQKVDSNYGFYYCFKCYFSAHLDCAIDEGNMEDIILLKLKEEESVKSKAMPENTNPKHDQSVDSKICKVIKTIVGGDETEFAIKIKYFSHEHDLKLTDEVPNNKICNRCIRAILPPSFYSCVNCSFLLHIFCIKLPKIIRYPLHQHPLMLTYLEYGFGCDACVQGCNGFRYICTKTLNSMFNVVRSQTMNISVVFVVLKDTMYSIVPHVNLF